MNYAKLLICLLVFSQTALSLIEGHNWMNSLRDQIGNKPLNQIFIPGSHDSATYKLEDTVAKDQPIPQVINTLKYIGIGFAATAIIKKWSKAQGKDIYQQLNDGVRYLDLRVVWRKSKDDFYIVHGLYGPKFTNVFEQIARFMRENPSEVLIVQIGDLRVMPSGSHDKLAQIIQGFSKSLGDITAKKSSGLRPHSKLNDFLNRRQRLIVIYEDDATAQKYDFLWTRNNINSYWANADNPTTLGTRLDQNLNQRRSQMDKFFVVQSQMTPSVTTMKKSLNIFAKNYKSLSDMAKAVQKEFSSWLKQWKERIPNIIIVDFVDATKAKQIYILNQTKTIRIPFVGEIPIL